MKSKLLLALIAGLAFACSEKTPEKAAPTPAPKVEAPKPAEPAKAAEAPKMAEAAPAGSAAPTAGKGCSNDCRVDVTVEETDGKCKITKPAKTDGVPVARGQWKIHWHLSGPAGKGYKFDSKTGIEFVPPEPNVFSNPGQDKPEHFRWDDDNKATKKYPYHINVTNGKISCKLDPSVDNE